MSERTAKRLADEYEKRVLNTVTWTRNKHVTLVCESEDESVLLAHELKKRGWDAESCACLAGGSVNSLENKYAVIVKKRKEKRSKWA